MTNVPGPGFVLLLAAAATLLALPLLAGASLLVARAARLPLARALLAVHAAAILVGVAAAALGPGTGFQDVPLGATVGLLRFALGALVAGLLVAAAVEGIPIALGALVTVLVRGVERRRGAWYATAGYALGGVGGAVVGTALTGRIEAAVVGALLATPAALGSALLEAAASRLGSAASTP